VWKVSPLQAKDAGTLQNRSGTAQLRRPEGNAVKVPIKVTSISLPPEFPFGSLHVPLSANRSQHRPTITKASNRRVFF
jgi:hypothetical protein